MNMNHTPEYVIGHRYLHSKSHQPLTLRYIGPLPSTDSLWLGVEYDDISFGKHDGVYQGVKMFKVLQEGAGAFIKFNVGSMPLRQGRTFVEVLEERYGSICHVQDYEATGNNVFSTPQNVHRVEGADQEKDEGVEVEQTGSTEQTGEYIWERGEISGRNEEGRGGEVSERGYECRSQRIEESEGERMFLGSSKDRIIVEAPNLEKIKRKFGRLERLKEIGVEGEWIWCLGGDLHLKKLLTKRLKGVKLLDMSKNLFSSWHDVAEIIDVLPGLETLVLNHSRLSSILNDTHNNNGSISTVEDPNLESTLKPLSQLKSLHLGHCHMSWDEICTLSSHLTDVESLHLNHNPLSRSITFRPKFDSLTYLSLEGCQLDQWKDIIRMIMDIPRLQTLDLSSNPFTTIPLAQETSMLFVPSSPKTLFDNTTTEHPLDCSNISSTFISAQDHATAMNQLTSLIMLETQCREWTNIDALSTWFPKLENLRISLSSLTPSSRSSTGRDIPFLEMTDMNDDRLIIIAKFPHLIWLNSTIISQSERRDAEIYYQSFLMKHQNPSLIPPGKGSTSLDETSPQLKHIPGIASVHTEGSTRLNDLEAPKNSLRSKMISGSPPSFLPSLSYEPPLPHSPKRSQSI
ncbi:hypothetical protein M231_02643 [Tremella mesenterica]|uniref:CAP-Gly domain-containing protein n=1 Tax=Tremella mesenterica TaxID=5217 RepID=A0A4Q1BQ27_TREME|nr:hypothetical protein M231_02643 [Tremella mesenterica]